MDDEQLKQQRAIAISKMGDFVEERDGGLYLKEGIDPAHPAIKSIETNEHGEIISIEIIREFYKETESGND